MLPPRDRSQTERYTQTKSKKLEKVISCKWKKNGSSTYIQQSTLKQGHSKRQRKTLHNDKGNNPTRGHNHRKQLYTQHRRLKYVKQILMDIKGEININTIIVGDYNILLSSMGRSSKQKINKETGV